MRTEQNPNSDAPVVTQAGLSAALEYVEEAVLCCDEDGTVRFASESLRTLLGYAPELFVGRNIIEIIHPDQLEARLEALTRWAGRQGSPQGEPTLVRSADGAWIEIRYDATIGHNFGTLGTLMLTLRLESSVDQVERDLRARAFNNDRIIRLSSVFLNLPTEDFDKGVEVAVSELASMENVTRISVWRANGDRVERQAAWEASVGAPKVPLSKRIRIADFISLKRAVEGKYTFLSEPWLHGPEMDPERELFLASETTATLIHPMSAADEFVGIVMVESTLPDQFGSTHLAAIQSATAILAEAFRRNDVERRLAHQARTDRVTGLANRWVFDTELDRALEDLRAGKMNGLALAIIDIDRFKAVNDTFGHHAGDRLLADVAVRLTQAAEPNVLLARLGGDELLVLIEGSDAPDEAIKLVEDLLMIFAVPFELSTGAIAATASAGVAHIAAAKVNATELLSLADVALYQVKAAGGNGIALANRESHLQRSRQLRREADQREAVYGGELIVHFQPEYVLDTRQLVGAEALVRWEHPVDGLLTAAEFVPIAESSELISELGHQVLRAACDTVAGWRQHIGSAAFLLRVNVASRQLHQKDFVAQVADALSDSGVSPSSLCLELTESTLLSDPTMAANRFNELRELGVGLAIDDFGTGFSSYLQLRSLPLTALKIDRSFVTDLPHSRTDRAIVEATIGLARALSLEVTAEGVETQEQLDALADLGCLTAQGFLLGRPMPAESFLELFNTQH